MVRGASARVTSTPRKLPMNGDTMSGQVKDGRVIRGP